MESGICYPPSQAFSRRAIPRRSLGSSGAQRRRGRVLVGLGPAPRPEPPAAPPAGSPGNAADAAAPPAAMASKAGKKKISSGAGTSSRRPSMLSKEAASNEKWRFPIWPEWSDADISAEKWDTGKAGKEKPGKGQISPAFDDPEGKIKLPASLKVHSWKRPQEFLTKEVPVIVQNETSFDLVSANEHIFCCELMRWIVSEIYALWRIYNENSLNSETPTVVWKPWEHIYGLCKSAKEPIIVYNKFGKYALKLYWMGCWRKIIVDDTMPFSEEENLLLPATSSQNELWPMLLSKAIIKLANTSIYATGKREMEEFTVLQTLTGWIPEVIPIQPEYLDKVWGFLKEIVPEFTLPERKSPELEITQDDTKTEETRDSELKSEQSSVNKLPDSTERAETAAIHVTMRDKDLGILVDNKLSLSQQCSLGVKKTNDVLGYIKKSEGADPVPSLSRYLECCVQSWAVQHITHMKLLKKAEQKKVGKKIKGGEKEKGKSTGKLAKAQGLQDLTEKTPPPPEPEVVAYAACTPLYLFEEDIFSLTRMADSSEKMRQYGLCHIHSHPVLITRTRSCPLVAPPEPPALPAWKLFRPKKEVVLKCETPEPVLEKPEKFVEIASLFFKYKLDIIKIPTNTHVSKSILKKGFQSMSHLASVTETDENESDSNGDMNQNGRHSNAEDYSQKTSPSLQQNAEVLSKEEHDNISLDSKQTPEKADTDMRSQTGTKSKDETASEKISVSRETWITFEDFCICFQRLYVFHKPDTYAYNYQKTSFKSSDEEVFYYLIVDSLMPIEMLVSFSALVHWYVTEGTQQECSTGVLRIEYFSWQSVAPGELVLKMHTSATKATIVNLPVGRHILLFAVTCPMGHHIQLCTTVPCVFGEEDAVMPALQKESSRFIEQATVILRAVGNVINNYSSEDELPKALKELEVAYCPPGLQDTKRAEENIKIFHNAFWYLIEYVSEKKDLYRYKFAFRSFTLDFEITDISGGDIVFSESNRNETSSLVDATHSSNPSEISEEKSLSSCENQTPTSEEEAAALKIQAIWRGTYIRKILKSREPGTKENTDVEETLKNLWTMIELNFEECAVTLLRELFKRNFNSVEKFPCYEDESCKMFFTDYAVTYADQPPNAWFLVFREIFIVPEDMFILTKVFTTIPFCRLHVLDNDTQEEMPHAFFNVAPHVYPKNKKGYTFVAEAHTGEQPVPGGKWKLRFCTSQSALPFLSREAVNDTFSTLQFKEYYIPNKEFLLFRYFVKVTAPHTATLQVQTSNSDVLIKLQVLDNEKEIKSVIGKGNAVIPVFNFRSNQSLLSSQLKKLQVIQSNTVKGLETGQLKKRSRNSSKDSKASSKADLVQECSVILTDESSASENFENNVGSPEQFHQYSIEALVLHDSWPLTASESLLVQELKEKQKDDIKVKKIANSPKSTRGSKDTVSEKTEKEESWKEGAPLQSQPGQSNAPYCILRIVSDQKEAEFLEVKKDTRRVDAIRAMKEAWESAEPGRAVKAFQERMRFINKYAVRDSEEPIAEAETDTLTPSSEEEDFVTTGKQSPQRAIDSRLETQEKKWELIDLSPYTRKTMSEPVLINESIIQQQQIRKEENFNHFRQLCMLVMEQRQKEENERILLKKNILEMYENLQVSLDEARGRVYSIREAYRNELLEAERRKEEELAALEAALKAERKKNRKR
ncbi:LOW QUALITY PROTEIN: androglobin [Ammospiza maritima maritima]